MQPSTIESSRVRLATALISSIRNGKADSVLKLVRQEPDILRLQEEQCQNTVLHDLADQARLGDVAEFVDADPKLLEMVNIGKWNVVHSAVSVFFDRRLCATDRENLAVQKHVLVRWLKAYPHLKKLRTSECHTVRSLAVHGLPYTREIIEAVSPPKPLPLKKPSERLGHTKITDLGVNISYIETSLMLNSVSDRVEEALSDVMKEIRPTT